MPTIILSYSFIFLVGLAIGGFVNVCIDCFPGKLDLKRAAVCGSCQRGLRWHERIPVISYLLQKGRCRSCGAKLSLRVPLVELANGALYIIVFMANGFNLMSMLYCLMTSTFLIIGMVDERTLEIPVSCNIFLGVLGIPVCVIDFSHLTDHIIGFFAISIVLYLLFLLSRGGAIGGGDVKLMAAGGLLLGWKLVTLAFFLGCIIAAFCHVIRMRVSKAERVLAMGPYLCLALWICALWGMDMINWYFSFLIH